MSGILANLHKISDVELRTLFTFCPDRLLPALDGKREILEHFRYQAKLFLGGSTTLLKRKIVPVHNFFWKALQGIWIRVFGEYEVKKIHLLTASRADIEALFNDEVKLEQLYLGALGEMKTQLPRYTLRVDGKTYSNQDKLADYLMDKFGKDKKQVVKAMMFMQETIITPTLINATEKMGRPEKGRLMTANPITEVNFNTDDLTLSAKTSQSLQKMGGRQNPIEFWLVQKMNLMEETAISSIKYQ